uniref:Serine/threonine-protein phosphatase n=1 Tax=Arcella intermedia TaxID=1963864 RepID=A0A6B2L7R6_9EUKA
MKAVAKFVLHQLTTFFKPDPSYNNTYGPPSHRWIDETQKKSFFNNLPMLCDAALKTLRMDPMLLQLKDPAYVLGDLHGSYKDLEYFSQNLWTIGIDFTPSKYIFLGDYVDRGPHSLEVISHLFCLKVLFPKQVFLLRGNHEFEDINGKTGSFSFLNQCLSFGGLEGEGRLLWKWMNNVFEWMPIAGVLDNKIFCCHGGLPRLILTKSNVLELVASIPRPLKDVEIKNEASFLALDLLWSDPAVAEREEEVNKNGGFGDNPIRGDNIKVFGGKAMDLFQTHTGCTHLIRAHQPPKLGIHISKTARVITVFSSSHYCGQYNSAAVVFVNEGTIKMARTSVIMHPNPNPNLSPSSETLLERYF